MGSPLYSFPNPGGRFPGLGKHPGAGADLTGRPLSYRVPKQKTKFPARTKQVVPGHPCRPGGILCPSPSALHCPGAPHARGCSVTVSLQAWPDLPFTEEPGGTSRNPPGLPSPGSSFTVRCSADVKQCQDAPIGTPSHCHDPTGPGTRGTPRNLPGLLAPVSR